MKTKLPLIATVFLTLGLACASGAELRVLESGPGQTASGLFPLARGHEFDCGRVCYTSLRPKTEYNSDSDLRKHMLGGIRRVMGDKATPQPPLHP